MEVPRAATRRAASPACRAARWGTAGEPPRGKWNLQARGRRDRRADRPRADACSAGTRTTALVEFEQYDFGDRRPARACPSVRLKNADGREVRVTTVFDLLMAQYGVARRGLGASTPAATTTPTAPTRPAWQEKYTGIDRKTVLGFAREWANTAETTGGKCMRHHRRRDQPLVPQQPDVPRRHRRADVLRLRGQERRRPRPLRRPGEAGPGGVLVRHRLRPRLGTRRRACRTRPRWHYVHSDQWRYEAEFTEYHTVPAATRRWRKGHTIDMQVKAVRSGWLPFYPQFDRSPASRW